MILTKYILAAFAFLIASTRTLANPFIDFVVTRGGSIVAIAERVGCTVFISAATCKTFFNGAFETVYDCLTVGGTNVDFHTKKVFV